MNRVRERNEHVAGPPAQSDVRALQRLFCKLEDCTLAKRVGSEEGAGSLEGRNNPRASIVSDVPYRTSIFLPARVENTKNDHIARVAIV